MKTTALKCVLQSTSQIRDADHQILHDYRRGIMTSRRLLVKIMGHSHSFIQHFKYN